MEIGKKENNRMGMSSSQARMLTLTARMHDIEYKAQRIEAQKLQLANDSARAYDDYLRVLDATKIQFKSINTDGTITFQDATLATLENRLVPNYSGLTSTKSFFLKDTRTGATYITKDYAESIGLTSDSQIFNGTLEEWLRAKGAPEIDKQVIVDYNTEDDTSKVISFTPVGNSNYSEFRYGFSGVANSAVTKPDKLVAGKTYTISNAEDLKHLATRINAGDDTSNITIILNNNIDMSGTTGFASIKNFKGEFNGNGHTISNLDTSLFDNLVNGSRVGNLKLSGGSVNGRGTLANTADHATIYDVEVSNKTVTNTADTSTGGLVGSATHSSINNCSFSGSVSGFIFIAGLIGACSDTSISNSSSNNTTVSGKLKCGGFIGVGNDISVTESAATNCAIYVNATGQSFNPDSGGFIGVCSGTSTIEKCSASGTFIDSTNDTNRTTVCAGFLGCTGDGGTVTIEDSYSSVNITSPNVQAIGFAACYNISTLNLKNCYYIGNITSNHGASYGFTYASTSESGTNTVNINGPCYTSETDYQKCNTPTSSGSVINGAGNITTTSITSIPTMPFSVGADLETTEISGAEPISNLGGEAKVIPNVQTGLFSNIKAVMIKMGQYDGATSDTKINEFLSLFGDNNADNSKLYRLNEEICTFLSTTATESNFTKNLIKDINAKTTSNTSSITNGETFVNIQRSTTSSSWTPGETKGTLTVPSKSTIRSNLVAAIKKSGEDVTESQIDSFLGLYSNSQQDIAYLGYVNEIIEKYSTGRSSLSTLVSNIKSGTKLEQLPSGVDEVSHYTFTQTSGDESGNIEIKYAQKKTPIYETRRVIDYDDERTKLLIQAYEAQKNGFIIIGDNNDPGMDKSNVWLTNMINSGFAILVEIEVKDGEKIEAETNIAINTALQEVSDEKDLKKAEAKYEADMRAIDRKDRKYDTELAACESERGAIKQEMDTLKTVIKDNVDRTFKLFS